MAEPPDSGGPEGHPALEYQDIPEEENTDDPMEEPVNAQADEPNFDPVLATQHAYLGHGEEIYGRTVFEEGSTVELPLLYNSAVLLVPGQTLPLSIFHPASVAMVRRVVAANKTFGFINTNCVRSAGSSETTVGTTAEIYEVKEDSEDAFTGFAVKAKGRQRFRVVSTRSQVDGTKVGLVQILADEVPDGPFVWCRPASVWRQRLPAPAALSVTDGPGGGRLVQVEAPPAGRRRRLARLDAAAAGWPAWLYALYEAAPVAARARADVQRCLLCRPDAVPTDPAELSYWVAMSLPLDDDVRAKLLRLDSVVRRLRGEISIMQKFKVMSCAECEQPVANSDDVFAMSAEGPQSIFVNPNGHLHETLTLHRASGLRCITRPSTEFSWFPGYAWEIAQCAQCSNHMGWRFTASSRALRPAAFWGLCRRSLTVRTDAAEGEVPSPEPVAAEQGTFRPVF